MIKRKDGRYQEQLSIIVNGNKKQKYFYGKTKAEVKQKMLAYQGEIEKGRTFLEVAEEWYDRHIPTLESNTLKSYLPAYKRALYRFGDIRINQITPTDINLFLLEFISTYKAARKTAATQRMILNLIFKHATISGDIKYNPVSEISIPKNLPKKKRELPSDGDIEKIKNSINCQFGLFAYFLLYTGCRKGEALAIQLKDINFESKTISISKSIYFVSNSPYIKRPKTTCGTREIILLDRLAEKIPKGKPTDYLFHNENGKLLSEKQFNKLWKLYCKESGISCTPHQLRHFFATILYEAGIPAKDAQELLGHANISTTQDIYTHIRKVRKDRVFDVLNNIKI